MSKARSWIIPGAVAILGVILVAQNLHLPATTAQEPAIAGDARSQTRRDIAPAPVDSHEVSEQLVDSNEKFLFYEKPGAGTLYTPADALDWVQTKLLFDKVISSSVVRLVTDEEFNNEVLNSSVNYDLPGMRRRDAPAWAIAVLVEGGVSTNLGFGASLPTETYPGMFVVLEAGNSSMNGYGFIGEDLELFHAIEQLEDRDLEITPTNVIVARAKTSSQ